jgi:hypothetical protein
MERQDQSLRIERVPQPTHETTGEGVLVVVDVLGVYLL